jgi:predicted membrane-bound spermidine synthase
MLFVLSGACGLAYEVVWTRFLGLFLGNTVLVHTVVLGTFMGGMAAGSLLVARRIERIAAPLKAYGWLEIAIATYALSFPWLSAAAESVVTQAGAALGPGAPLLVLVKLGAAAALLLPPTLLMGMTLPLLTAHAEAGRRASDGVYGDGANWLYGANCAGAVLGTLVTGFGLIPGLGLTATVLGVALVNAGIGFVAVAAGGRAARLVPTLRVVSARSPHPDERRTLWAIALSGATAFLYELVWTRLFSVSLGSSTYAFTLMLAAFISGLALGSALAGVLPVRRAPLTWFAVAELLIGLSIAASLALYPRLPYWCWQWRWALRATDDSVGLYRFFQYTLIFAVMALPTTLFGLTFPAAIRALARRAVGASEVAMVAARVYGWNTMGTLVGVVVAGFALIPWLGLQGTLRVGAGINLALGLWLLGRPLGGARTFVIALGGLGALLVVATPRWTPGAFTYGQFRANVPPPPSFDAFDAALRREPLLFYREDFGTTVAVRKTPSDAQPGTDQLVLFVDGKADASSIDDMATQRLVGHLPLFFKPDARRVFVLGLGSGTSAGSVLTHPTVQHVDCVEISRAVADAAQIFETVNGAPRTDPRFHLTIDDGRAFLAASRPGTYDLIVSEPTNPWIAGVGTLFSEETFRLAARALTDDGIVAQWFHTNALDDRLAATIVRTCRQVFPHAVLFRGSGSDSILIASRQPLPVDFSGMEREFARPKVRADLERIGVRSLLALLGQQTHSDTTMAALEQGGGINADDQPILEFLAPNALFTGASARRIQETDERRGDGAGLLATAYLRQHGIVQGEWGALIDSLSDRQLGDSELAMRALRGYLARWPADTNAWRRLAQHHAAAGRRTDALLALRQAATHGDRDAAALADRLAQGDRSQPLFGER